MWHLFQMQIILFSTTVTVDQTFTDFINKCFSNIWTDYRLTVKTHVSDLSDMCKTEFFYIVWTQSGRRNIDLMNPSVSTLTLPSITLQLDL